MDGEFKNYKLAVLGGDDREIVLIEHLARLGAEVKIIGFEQYGGELAGVTPVGSIEEALDGVQGIVLPMVGTDDKGVIRAVYHQEPLKLEKRHLEILLSDTPITIGVAKQFLRLWCYELRLNLIELADMDEMAILNSIPTAEGAIQVAMQEAPITIHGSKSVVVGFGRVGQTMAHMLYGLGAEVTVVARSSSDRAKAVTMGYRAIDYVDFASILSESEFVFNTVPAMVINEDLLKSTAKNCLIIDLATQPGGTDFQVAANLGIKAILAPGLPGKVAPTTAGEILSRIVPRLFEKNIVAHG